MAEAEKRHEWENDVEFGDFFTVFYCHGEERACKLKNGEDFDYCPYCGMEVEYALD